MTDKPVSDKELDQFYGKEATEIEIAQTIGAAAAEFGPGELADVAYEQFEAIADVLGDAEAVGRIVIQFRKQWIADHASRAIFGKIGMIKPEEVKL